MTECVAEQPVDLHQGENRFPLSIPTQFSPGRPVVRVTLHAASDSIPENNVRRLRLWMPENHRILLIANPVAAGIRDSGTRWPANGFTVDADTPDRLPHELARLADYSLIVLARCLAATDRRSRRCESGAIRPRRRRIDRVGGDGTYGHSVYHQSRLEELLPVTAAAAVETRPPVLALMLVIDRSGSMVVENRMELARRAARQSIELLEPLDQAGVMAFSDGPLWVAEMQPVGEPISSVSSCCRRSTRCNRAVRPTCTEPSNEPSWH
jgi:Ca-activated chloride channel homolog